MTQHIKSSFKAAQSLAMAAIGNCGADQHYCRGATLSCLCIKNDLSEWTSISTEEIVKKRSRRAIACKVSSVKGLENDVFVALAQTKGDINNPFWEKLDGHHFFYKS